MDELARTVALAVEVEEESMVGVAAVELTVVDQVEQSQPCQEEECDLEEQAQGQVNRLPQGTVSAGLAVEFSARVSISDTYCCI